MLFRSRIRGALYDVNNQAGTNGQVLITTGSGIDWVDGAPSNAITGLTFQDEGVQQGAPGSVTVVNFVGSGNTIQQTSGTSLTTNLITPLYTGTWNLYGQIPVQRNSARPIQKVVSKTNSNEGLLSVEGDILLPGSTTTTGVVSMPKNTEVLIGGHAMMLVGYDKSNFIVRNSWGDKWGDGGYCYVPYNYLTDRSE